MNHTLEAALEKLRHPAPSERSAAVFALLDLHEADKLPILLIALQREPEVLVREDITYALVQIGDAAVPPLIDLMGDQDAHVRHHAAHVLGKIGDARAVDALIRALRDQDAAVVTKAAFALSQIGDARAVPALTSLLGHENRDIQTMLISVLEHFSTAAVPFLLHAIEDTRWQVREQAADVLGAIGHDAAVPSLAQALQDTQWQVRFAAATALSALGGSAAHDALHTLHDDPEPRVSHLAATLLRRIDWSTN